MSWNYRIVRYADGSGYGLHEVHYGSDGTACSMTADAARFDGDTSEEIRDSLLTAKMDATRRLIFDEPDDWEEQ